MKILFIKIILLLYFTPILSSQTIVLTGKVYDENKNPLGNINLRFISIGNIVTSNSGEFKIEVPANINLLEVETVGVEWKLVYPIDSRIPVPANKESVLKVVISKSFNKEKNLKPEEIAKNYSKLEKLLTDLGLAQSELKTLFDSYVTKESGERDLSEEYLKTIITKEKRRDKFAAISEVLLKYILKIQNLASTFKLVSTLALKNSSALSELINSIEEYNSVFNQLNNGKTAYQNDISIYWENKNLPDEFISALDFGIDEIHKIYILKLNEEIVIINKINSGFIEDGDERNELQSKTIGAITLIVNELETRIPILEKKVNNLINHLKEET